nr:hypothetical protein CFP56_37291 [Quercus suber]
MCGRSREHHMPIVAPRYQSWRGKRDADEVGCPDDPQPPPRPTTQSDLNQHEAGEPEREAGTCILPPMLLLSPSRNPHLEQPMSPATSA